MFDREAAVDPSIREALFAQVRLHTGIVMAERKWTMLHGRLRRRLQELQLSGYEAYLALLGRSKHEVGCFIDLVTTNETSFFRTPRIWQYLEEHFFPRWHAAHPGATMQIWSAAASTGEEGYSLAMLANEFRQKHPDFSYRILATDISQAVLDVAAAGSYAGRNAKGLQASRPEMVERYFVPEGDGYTARPALKAHLTFRPHNLYQDLTEPTRFDLVLLRNVLIYFDEPGQEAVVERVRRAMAPESTLIIGESESLHRIRSGFTYEQPLIYRNTKTA